VLLRAASAAQWTAAATPRSCVMLLRSSHASRSCVTVVFLLKSILFLCGRSALGQHAVEEGEER